MRRFSTTYKRSGIIFGPALRELWPSGLASATFGLRFTRSVPALALARLFAGGKEYVQLLPKSLQYRGHRAEGAKSRYHPLPAGRISGNF